VQVTPTAKRIPHAEGYRPQISQIRLNVCPICGKRVNKPGAYLRHVNGWMFPCGMIPDEGACFSAVHSRCVEQFALADYVYSAVERLALEAGE